MRSPRPDRRRRSIVAGVVAVVAAIAAFAGAQPAVALSYTSIAGEGSSWAGQAWVDWIAQAANEGVTVTYNPNGSSVGRTHFAQQNNAVFADSEIPFTGDASDPADDTLPGFSYGMLPIVAGGTAFMYNLPVNGTRYTKLKLTMDDIAGIFSGRITNWNQLQADNPGVALPNHQIIVVVRSDGSGATAQFKLWMLRQFPSDYANLAQHTGGDASHASSYFPTGDFGTCSSSSQPCFTAQNGSTGVTTFTVNTPYSIDYDEYAYALGAAFPVAQVKNAAGFYTLPTAQGVAVALIKAKINTNQADPNYLSQDLSDVYKYQDPRAYPMSMYSYEIIPKQTNNVTSTARGATLAWLSVNAVCEWQRDMGPLGYSPLPMNLVLASLDQLKQIPGIDSDTSAAISATEQGVLKGGANPCNNPTFQPGDDPSHNVLVDTAPFPSGCDATCQAPWKLAGAGTAASGPKQEQQSSTNPTSGTGTTSQGGSGGGGGSVSPGGAGTGTDTTSGDGTAPVPTAAAACDADTGVCAGGTGDGTTGTNGSVQEASNVQAVPTTIAGDVGWTTTQTLGLLAALLVVLVLLAPPILDRMLSTRRGRSGP